MDASVCIHVFQHMYSPKLNKEEIGSDLGKEGMRSFWLSGLLRPKIITQKNCIN